jgi:3-oxoadipate CoA-transferase, alpha subunit
MINKISPSITAALADIHDGATIMIGGFGTAGIPNNGETGLAALLKTERVKKLICSFPRQVDSHIFDGLYRSGKLQLELVPQGTLSERIRAAGAGIGAFFVQTAYGTELAKNLDGTAKETRLIDGKHYVLEAPIHADFALIKAEAGDRWGNLTYRKTARCFGPVMAMAAKQTIATVHEVVELGAFDPETVVTPGIFVSKIVKIERTKTQGGGFKS